MIDVPIPTFLSIDDDENVLHGLTPEQRMLAKANNVYVLLNGAPRAAIRADTERGYVDIWNRPTFAGNVHRLWGEVRIEVRNA